MDQLIKALQLFRKYGNPDCPTHCEHDVMYVMIDPAKVSGEDKVSLTQLGFHPSRDGNFQSYRFGSA